MLKFIKLFIKGASKGINLFPVKNLHKDWTLQKSIISTLSNPPGLS